MVKAWFNDRLFKFESIEELNRRFPLTQYKRYGINWDYSECDENNGVKQRLEHELSFRVMRKKDRTCGVIGVLNVNKLKSRF